MTRTDPRPPQAALRVSTEEVGRRDAALADVRARREQLEDLELVRQVRRDCDARTVQWRSYDEGAFLHRPEPYIAEQAAQFPGRWLRPGESGPRPIRCGIDEQGRVLSARDPVEPAEKDFITYGPDYDEMVRMRYDDDLRYGAEVTRTFRHGDGRVDATAYADGYSAAWTQYFYDNAGLLQAAADFGVGERDPYRITRFTHDVDGRLATIQLASIHWSDRVVWDARVHAREDHLPTFAEIVDGIAEPIARAIAEVASDAMRELPDAVFIRSDAGWLSPLPSAGLVSQSFIQRKRVEGLSRDEIVIAAEPDPDEPGLLDLYPHVLDRLGPDVQRRLRQFRQRREAGLRGTRGVPDIPEDDPNSNAVATKVEIHKLLNGPEGIAPLPVVAWSNPGGYDAPRLQDHGLRPPTVASSDLWWTLTAATAGVGTVEALWALLNNPD